MLDAVLTNGHFLTQNPKHPVAKSIAIKDGKILALDSDAQHLADNYPSSVRFDLHGSTVVPGFNDIHAHSVWFGQTLIDIDLSAVSSTNELYEVLKNSSNNGNKGSKEWITAAGYNPHNLQDGPIDIAKLDAITHGRPLLLKHNSGHAFTVNTTALYKAGINPASPPQIEGGEILTNSEGIATGVLNENAMRPILDTIMPESGAYIIEALDRATRYYLAEGLTSVCDAGVAGGWIGHSPREFGHYQTARAQGKLHTRMQPMITIDALHYLPGHEEDTKALGLDAGIRTGLGDEHLSIGSVKIFTDGSLLGATAAMTEAYCHCPHTSGYFQGDPEIMRKTALQAAGAGWALALHAIGDAAIDLALRIIEEANQRFGPPPIPHRIEHGGVVRTEQLKKMSKNATVLVPQARFIAEFGDAMIKALGNKRVSLSYPCNRLFEAGLILPGSSDRPVANGAPLKVIESMVTRLTETGEVYGPQERISIEQALYAYTAGSSAATGWAGKKGQIAPNQLADLAVLGANPLDVPPTELGSIPVKATLLGGNLVYGTI